MQGGYMRAAVILSGCGYLDGAEIRESVLSLLYLDQQDVDVTIFAPDISLYHVMNHVTCEPETGGRNVLQESARIARSKVENLADLEVDTFDLLVIPGGFGVAKNLSDFAFSASQAVLNEDFANAIDGFYDAKKPIAAICIAPAVLALALRDEGIELTIGDDADIAEMIEKSGNKHVVCASDETCTDTEHRIVTCSAYMREDSLSRIAAGIEKTLLSAVSMAKDARRSKAA
jgi:enhancing lycopene biosynthesis protein 2